MGRCFQHLKAVRDKGEKDREGVARGDGRMAVTGVVEEGVLSRTLVLRLRDCLKARTRTV